MKDAVAAPDKLAVTSTGRRVRGPLPSTATNTGVRRIWNTANTSAKGAEAAALARERHEQVTVAARTVNATNTEARVPASDRGAQFGLDVARQRAAAMLVLEAGEEGLEMFAQNGVDGVPQRSARTSVGPALSRPASGARRAVACFGTSIPHRTIEHLAR